jgi:hypothetical protein
MRRVEVDAPNNDPAVIPGAHVQSSCRSRRSPIVNYAGQEKFLELLASML